MVRCHEREREIRREREGGGGGGGRERERERDVSRVCKREVHEETHQRVCTYREQVYIWFFFPCCV